MKPFERILVGLDDSERGIDALRLGDLLARTTEAELCAARVSKHPEGGEQQRLSADVAGLLGESSVETETVALGGDSPAGALEERATRRPGVGLIVVGSTHRAGAGRVYPGSTARRLLDGAPCAIAVAPRGYAADDLRVIEVGYDASSQAEIALQVAAALGEGAKATLRVLAVDSLATPARPAASAGATAGVGSFDLQEKLHTRVSELPDELRALPVFEHGDPARVLLDRAEEGVDLVVIGSRGYGPLRVVLLGSVSVTVVENALCPVLVTPRPAPR